MYWRSIQDDHVNIRIKAVKQLEEKNVSGHWFGEPPPTESKPKKVAK